MKIILSGGGTLGPVVPLLAAAKMYQKKYPQTEFIWVGTADGPERSVVEKNGFKFVVFPSGKFRRYFSLTNILDVFKIIVAFLKAIFFLHSTKPNLLISFGGFVSVPLHWAGGLFGIKSWIHQQDFEVGLANKLMMPFAYRITVTLEKNLKNFPKNRTEWIGNPVRQDIFIADKISAKQFFSIQTDLPVVLVMGGGTGSLIINKLIVEALPLLENVCEIIHLTGKDRSVQLAGDATKIFANYHPVEFLNEEMCLAYALAEIVVSRGGFASISELAALSKPTILIPKEGHQQENVKFITDAGAAFLIDERVANGTELANTIKQLLEDKNAQEEMADKIHAILPPTLDGKVIEIIDSLVQ